MTNPYAVTVFEPQTARGLGSRDIETAVAETPDAPLLRSPLHPSLAAAHFAADAGLDLDVVNVGQTRGEPHAAAVRHPTCTDYAPPPNVPRWLERLRRTTRWEEFPAGFTGVLTAL